jgi:hypothetical protein
VPTLTLPRVLGVVAGLGLVAAFFMPWFQSQGLLLSGQFLHLFLTTASPAEQRRFLPSSSPTEVQLLRALVDLFPIAGALAAAASLLGGLVERMRTPADIVLGLSGLLTLAAWAAGVTRLPPGSTPEIGLYATAASAISILLALTLEVATRGSAGAPG